MTTSPRVAPLAPSERDAGTAELLERLGPAAGMNIFTTLARHPRLFKRWTAFGGVLLTGELPARDRELLILRTAHRCAADYEWAHHLDIARRAGLDDAEIERVVSGPEDPAWSKGDAALLRAADELHDEQRIADTTWEALAARYDERQLIEVCMVVGQYHLVAFVLRSLGIELEDGERVG
jgi:4-carboxymuconolactone decarboxylase